jgi:hypothetical protein
MKSFIQHLLILLLTIFTYSCLSKNENQKNTIVNDLDCLNFYEPRQEVIAIDNNGTTQYSTFKLDLSENYLDFDNNKIHLEIPVSNKNQKIANIINISSYQTSEKINAIIIHLKSTNKESISSSIATHKIISDIDINQIVCLNIDILKNEEKLKFFLIKTKFLTLKVIKNYQFCLINNTNCSPPDIDCCDGCIMPCEGKDDGDLKPPSGGVSSK